MTENLINTCPNDYTFPYSTANLEEDCRMGEKDKEKKSKSQKPEESQEPEIDLGLGSFSFGGLLKGLGNLIDLAAKVSEEGKEFRKEGTFKVGGKGMKGVYGISVRTLAGGKPVIQRFGNIVKETPKGPVVEDVREPLVDVFDEEEKIKVIAEMPGVSEDEIKVEIKGDILAITTTGTKQYAKEILLPAKVKEASLKSTYRNGILEVEVEKA